MNEPLGLPKGSVRSILALGQVLLMAGVTAFALVQDAASELTMMVVGADIATVSSIATYYFVERAKSG